MSVQINVIKTQNVFLLSIENLGNAVNFQRHVAMIWHTKMLPMIFVFTKSKVVNINLAVFRANLYLCRSSLSSYVSFFQRTRPVLPQELEAIPQQLFGFILPSIKPKRTHYLPARSQCLNRMLSHLLALHPFQNQPASTFINYSLFIQIHIYLCFKYK